MSRREITHVSDTARMVTACRALESESPDGLVYDPFASQLAGEHGMGIVQVLQQLVPEILDNFEFRNQIPRVSKTDALVGLIAIFLDPRINLGPDPVYNGDGSVKRPGLDNHVIGTIFAELARKFNKENDEQAGEHWTPKDAVKLMSRPVFPPVADQILSVTYLRYDGACVTGGIFGTREK